MSTEAQTLATAMARAREATHYYFNKLKDTDLHFAPQANGVTLHSAFWLVAHLAVSENGLLLFATGGPGIKFSWAKHYTKGSAMHGAPEPPPFSEVWEMFNTVHDRALQHVASLTAEQLDAPNLTGTRFGGQEQVRDVIMGAIRHEGYHCGQLGWLCRMQGITTF